ncbi:unnamed protein product [Rotaria sp. Silwood1]|nr:unnamed protein product [Rotaria sp. Silwood1]CAF4828331.1 unnamed protein product [Rotaria sp. Silwood1]
MLPTFQKKEIIEQLAQLENTLQVIIKAQSYNLKVGMKYTVRWYTESSTENIIATGVYYVHVDHELKGGALKFCRRHALQPWYSTRVLLNEASDGCLMIEPILNKIIQYLGPNA